MIKVELIDFDELASSSNCMQPRQSPPPFSFQNPTADVAAATASAESNKSIALPLYHIA